MLTSKFFADYFNLKTIVTVIRYFYYVTKNRSTIMFTFSYIYSCLHILYKHMYIHTCMTKIPFGFLQRDIFVGAHLFRFNLLIVVPTKKARMRLLICFRGRKIT